MKGLVFDIQRYAMHDGPGIRTLVFLKGCPLRCSWCANPESQTMHNEIMILESECIGMDKCGLCLKECDKEAVFEKEGGLAGIHREKCDHCGKCSAECPSRSLQDTAVWHDTKAVADMVMEDIKFYLRSGGGATLSGGEPFFQFDFCLELLKELKSRGLHTAVETTLYADWDSLLLAVPFIDLFLIDLKHMDDGKHKQYTGVSNERILENVKKLYELNKEIEFRIPLIPGANDDLENLEETARFISQNTPKASVKMLPYHRLGQVKYDQLGREYEMKDINPVKVKKEDPYFTERNQVFERLGISLR